MAFARDYIFIRCETSQFIFKDTHHLAVAPDIHGDDEVSRRLVGHDWITNNLSDPPVVHTDDLTICGRRR